MKLNFSKIKDFFKPNQMVLGLFIIFLVTTVIDWVLYFYMPPIDFFIDAFVFIINAPFLIFIMSFVNSSETVLSALSTPILLSLFMYAISAYWYLLAILVTRAYERIKKRKKKSKRRRSL